MNVGSRIGLGTARNTRTALEPKVVSRPGCHSRESVLHLAPFRHKGQYKLSIVIEETLRFPSGARFHRCAFQVNPFDYLVRHGKPLAQPDEATYNSALVAALVDAQIDVIAITDHYRIRSSISLINAAKEAGITVFPGFEAATKEGIHILCLFDPATSIDSVQAKIHACGVHDDKELSPLGDLSAEQLLSKCAEWGMQCIAAHATQQSGLLTTLRGQPRAKLWKHPCLMAIAVPGPIDNTPIECRRIIENKDPEHRRDRPIAVLNCGDISCVEDIRSKGACCWVKMSSATLEGLRQAFLDPISRIRLDSDPALEEHVEFAAIAWETSGFLRSLKLHLNENLNVLIGGRGTGKSTVIESFRYVLDLPPIGAEASKVHQSIVQNVLRSGTKISLVVRSYRPNRRTFIIERTVNNPPVVRDAINGDVLPLRPLDIVPRAAVFGQNEISELARSPEKLTALLDRFTSSNGDMDGKYHDCRSRLESSRRELIEFERKLSDTEERLASLPSLEESLRRYRDAGVEEKLKDQEVIVREQAVIKAVGESLEPFSDYLEELNSLLPLAQESLSDEALKDLPSQAHLIQLRSTIASFEGEARRAADVIKSALVQAHSEIEVAKSHVEIRKNAVQGEYEKILRELQREKIDGAEFVRLRTQIEKLKPLREQKARIQDRIASLKQRRRNELADWEDLKRERFERLEKAARKVSKQLVNRLRVTVKYGGDRQALTDLLKGRPGGRLAETLTALQSKADLSVAALAEACRDGANALVKEFNIPLSQAQRLVEAGPELQMMIEELDLPPVTNVELNTAPDGRENEWRALDSLSTGQKATAMLYLLLIESEAPLIIDQLEDNLDNRFISEGIVPEIKAEKRRRQFIFATHNANIPVLGDAELILGFSAVGDAGDGHLEVTSERMGSIDTPAVRAMVEEILEGGKEAFTTRRLKYGF